MRFLFYTSIIFLLLSFSAGAEEKKDLSFGSPDGRWTVMAGWVSDKDPVYLGHYVYELRDARSGKAYFKETSTDENDKSLHPHRLRACWSPDGRYVAINLYYGRIAYWVSIIDVFGKQPREIPLFPKMMSDYDDFLTSANRWLDNASLEIEAFQPVNWSGTHYATTYKLVVRFEKGGSKVVKKEKEQP
jgi:hypothetical protein